MTQTAQSTDHFDIEFFWDPVCPFAWLTSRWITEVSRQTGYRVDWRFISLRLLNKQRDYSTEFPPGYEDGHDAGLRMLRVAAAASAACASDPSSGSSVPIPNRGWRTGRAVTVAATWPRMSRRSDAGVDRRPTHRRGLIPWSGLPRRR